MTSSPKLTQVLLSSILVLGIAGIAAILSGGKFVYAISDPISSPIEPSPSPIVSEPITPSPSPLISPSPEISPSPLISPSPVVSPTAAPSEAPSPTPIETPTPIPSPTPTPTPETVFKAEYFNGNRLRGSPVFENTVSEINFDWGRGSPDPSVNRNNFSARWKGTKFFEGGRYRVTTSNDDGLRFFMDGYLIHSAWYDQWAQENTFEMDIYPGVHRIKVEYYEDRGDASARIKWEKLQ